MNAQLPNVPLTIKSTTLDGDSEIVLDVSGGAHYKIIENPKPNSAQYWMVIFDRCSLEVVENFMFFDSNTIPIKAKPYLGNSDFFYVLTTQSMLSSNVPSGPFYKWLMSKGAGVGFNTIGQAYSSLNDDDWSFFSYTLIDVFGSEIGTLDYFNLQNRHLLSAIQLHPLVINGKTTYSPIELKYRRN